LQELNYSSVDIAAYVASWCAYYDHYINTTKVRCLCFFVYGSVLSECDTRICKDHPELDGITPFLKKYENLVLYFQ
jgi:hypothetical protein